jgi:hypothetical protein
VATVKLSEKHPCRQLHTRAAWEVSGIPGVGMRTDGPLVAVCMPSLSSSNDL